MFVSDPPGHSLRIYLEQAGGLINKSSSADKPVVLIINGNGYYITHYESIAKFLARNGFIAAVGVRENGNWTDPGFVVEALEVVFAELDLQPDTPVAVVGHSKGGLVAVNGTVQNHDL